MTPLVTGHCGEVVFFLAERVAPAPAGDYLGDGEGQGDGGMDWSEGRRPQSQWRD